MSFFAPAAPDPGAFLSAAALMARWNISRTTLWEWRKNGIPGSGLKLPFVKLGRQLLFRRDAVERVEADLEAMTAAPAPARRRRRRSAA